MTEYICKCKEAFQKSSTAETTGYRNVDDCAGCPYVMDYGQYAWDKDRRAMVVNVEGQECIASKTITYTTKLVGTPDDKTSLHLYSLDFDFLEEVCRWIKTEHSDSLNASFDRSKIRRAEFASCGRYRMSILPEHNKQGIAAKKALIKHFFNADGNRLDMTPEDEAAKIMTDIVKGKMAAAASQLKNAVDHSDSGEQLEGYRPGDLYRDPTDHSLYRVADTTPKAKTRLWQIQEDIDGDGDWQAYNGSVYPHLEDAVSTLATIVKTHGLVKWEPELPEFCRGCKCLECGNDGCECHGDECSDQDRRDCEQYGCLGANCKDWMPKDAAECSKISTSGQDSPAESGSAEPACAAEPPAVLDAASLTATADLTPAGFDYGGLDAATVDTLHVAERMIFEGRRDYIIATAQAVSIAHEVLCTPVVQNLDNGKFAPKDDTFRAWCAYVGISKSMAYNFLKVSELLNSATPEELATLENASPSLLYAAAKPSAPPQLVQAVKDGDITSHKQYQEALSKIKELQETNSGLQMANDTLREEQSTLRTSIDRARCSEDAANQRAAAAEADAADARRRAAEAEARPVEVVGASPEDIERWRAEGAAAAQREVETMRRYIERREKEDAAKIQYAEAEAKKAKQEAKQAKDTLKGRTDHLAAVEKELQRKNELLKEISPDATVAAIPCSCCIYENVCMGIDFINTPVDERDAANNRMTGCTGGVRKKKEE